MLGKILVVGWLAFVAGCAGGGEETGLCSGVDCSGHGVCAVTGGEPRCFCEAGYDPEGLECLAVSDPCAGVECSGHGACAVSQGEPRCFCDEGFYAEGLECLAEVDPCAGVECSGHGSCEVQDGSPVCICDIGYHAEDLDCVANDPEDPCRGVTCSGHGTCVAEQGQASCQCDDGYHAEGLACVEDTVDPQCEGIDCSGHGRCVVVDGQAACVCDTGYAADGLACVPIDPCAGVTCSGHGECLVLEGRAVCQCEPGYIPSGTECLPEQDDGTGPVWFVHVSDTHFGESLTVGTITEALVDEVIPSIGPALTINSGDVTDSGSLLEWSDYRSRIDGKAPPYPAYLEIPGNHDVKHDNTPNFLSESQTGRAGGGMYGQTFIETPSGRIRLLRANTSDSDTNAVNLAGYFGQAQFDALSVLVDQEPPSRFVVATGHHPLTGLERLYLGFDRMEQLLAGAGARVYFCGHLHWKTFAWLGETLVSQVDSQGKSDTPAFALVSLDHTGPAARFVDMEPFVAWPLVLITTPANPDLGRQNPYATQYPTGSQLTVRAIAFSPGGVEDVVFQLGGYDQAGVQISPNVFETTYALPDAAADLTLKATATSTIGTGSDEITVDVAP